MQTGAARCSPVIFSEKIYCRYCIYKIYYINAIIITNTQYYYSADLQQAHPMQTGAARCSPVIFSE